MYNLWNKHKMGDACFELTICITAIICSFINIYCMYQNIETLICRLSFVRWWKIFYVSDNISISSARPATAVYSVLAFIYIAGPHSLMEINWYLSSQKWLHPFSLLVIFTHPCPNLKVGIFKTWMSKHGPHFLINAIIYPGHLSNAC